MKQCLLLYVYKKEREFNIEILKEVYEESIVFFTDRILALDLSKIEWDNIFPAIRDFNTGLFMVVNYRYIDILRFAMKNGYKILSIEFYDDVKEDSRKLIDEIVDFINSDTINPIIKNRIFGLLKEEFDWEEYENDNSIRSIKIQLDSEVEFCNCTRIEVDENISEKDLIIIKNILDSISD